MTHRWYVSYEGRVEQRPEDPGAGWSEVIDPDQLPDNYNPKTDQWIHLVVGPEGAVLVPLTLVEDPGEALTWKREGDILTVEQWLEETANDGHDIYGVGTNHGKIEILERWK